LHATVLVDTAACDTVATEAVDDVATTDEADCPEDPPDPPNPPFCGIAWTKLVSDRSAAEAARNEERILFKFV
jgi:hypothetical protein